MIREIFEKNQIALTDRQVEQFQKYYELLVDWNQKINLTSITEYQDVIWKHFLDSGLFVNCQDLVSQEQKTVLDLGTGAGFPGIPLAILIPNYEFTLVDSLRKRIDFLEIVCKELKLENVKLYHGRAEDVGKDSNFREQFDFAVSRAVADLPVLLEYCLPFVKVGGRFVSYKSRKYEEEMDRAQSAMEILHCSCQNIYEFSLEFDQSKRYLLSIEKKEETDSKYPRKPNKIKKNPL